MMRRAKLFLLNLANIFKIHQVVPWKDMASYLFPFYGKEREKLMGISIKNLSSGKVYLRRGSIIDRDVIKYVFYNQYHLPLDPLSAPEIILDLGSNIGLTLLHFRELYPGAKLLGYEMDKENFEIALKNTQGLERCALFNKAVWSDDGLVQYAADDYEDGYHILRDDKQPAGRSKLKTARAITMAGIIQEHALTRIDYMKIDIEGAEKNIFDESSSAWLRLVQQLNIEIHDVDFFQPLVNILEARGFICEKDIRHKSLLRAARR